MPYDGAMASFIGGSAQSMVRQVAEGYVLVTERNFKRMQRGELDTLAMEIEKSLRETRGDQPALDDLDAIKLRNRKIQRLNTCRMMLRTYRQRRRV